MSNKGITVTLYGQDFTPFDKGLIKIEYNKEHTYNLQEFSNLIYKFHLVVKSINEYIKNGTNSFDFELVRKIKRIAFTTNYDSPLINNIAQIVKDGCDLLTDIDETYLHRNKEELIELREQLAGQINKYNGVISKLFELFSKFAFNPISDNFTDPKQDQILKVGHSDGTQPSSYTIADNGWFGNIVGTITKRYDDDFKEIEELIIQLLGIKRISKNCFPVIIKLEIYSRFDDFNQLIKSDKKPSPYFLASLLLKSKGIESAGMHFSSSFNWDSLFDMFLITLISKTLKKAITKGIFKKYQRYEVNSSKIRGSIDIARHIKLNADLDNGKIACSYRENTTDNMAIHLVITALDQLKSKYPDIYHRNIDQNTQQIINSLKFEIGYPKYNRKTLIAKNSIKISHPYYFEYRILQDYSLKVLRGEGVSPFGNDNESIEGILFYVPDLWEEYLEYYLKKYNRYIVNSVSEMDTSYPEFKLHSQKKIGKMSAYTKQPNNVSFDSSESKPQNESRPDFVFSFKNVEKHSFYTDYVPFYMIDAKYREKWKEALTGTLDNDKIGEDYDKCLRDMVSIDAKAAAVVFPIKENEFTSISESQKGSSIMIAHRFSKFNRNGVFYTFPVIIPELNSTGISYYTWDRILRERINSSLKSIYNSLKYEYQKAVIYHNYTKEINQSIDNLSQKISVEGFVPVVNSDSYMKSQSNEEN